MPSIIKYGFYTFLLLLVVACGTDIPEEVEVSLANLPPELDYNIDVKPLLSDRCYHCHGPDEQTRGAGVRLDTKEGMFAPSENGNKPFVAGSISKSAVIERILSDDPSMVMPPPDSQRTLSSKEKATLIKWVEQGAEWKEHWSFIPPEKSEIPQNETDWKVANEIDNFIYEKLVENKLTPSEETEKEQLIRRVSFDLTGLPPTLEDIEYFLNDSSPDAYEKLVDRLMETDAYAERMALEWLDVARYADSHGFHADGSRTAWPWRDWVIDAFKENKPYDEFITEQLAGDLMPNPSKDQIIATAFNRNHPMTAEGGVVDEEFRLEYVANRTNTFGTALLGLTIECAKCHDHKFDPISQKEYFQVSSFFNNIKELGMTGDDGDYGPMILLSDQEKDELISFVESDIKKEEDNLSKIVEESGNADFPLITKKPISVQHFERLSKSGKHKIFDQNAKVIAKGDIEVGEGVSGNAPIFDHQDDRVYLEKTGEFEAYQPFSVSLWVNPEKASPKTNVLIGNAGAKNDLWRGWDFYLDSTDHPAFRLISSLPHNYLHVRSGVKIDPQKWTHLTVTYDGSMNANGIKIFVDGTASESQIVYNRLYKTVLPTNTARTLSHRAVRIGKSYRAFTGDNGIFKGSIDEVAIFDCEIPSNQIGEVMKASQQGQSPMVSLNPNIEKQNKVLLELRKKKLDMLDTIPELMVMEELAKPRDTYILQRGEYDKPTKKVEAGTIEKVLAYNEELPKNRLGLSKWLFTKENPLTARVAVNRYWQMIFGKGIITTVNDFGNQGALPSHPKLIDWLAVEFIESGWDVKALIKKMVKSQTYRQSSKITPELYEADAANTLLARGPSYRWQAEFIRDNALAASGLLNSKVGGESAKPYQPEGLWIELGNFSHFLKHYKPDKDNNQYRRSLYTFIRRTSPPPFMTIFDAPNREVCTVSRERTNTPLQALVLLNDPQFIEASKALAYRLLNEGGTSFEEKMQTGFRLVLSRNPEVKETELMAELYEKELEAFNNEKKNVEEFLSIGDYEVPSDLDLPSLAAMTIVSNTLLNMDEAYTKR